ncbi:MAG: CRISPR-associated helicase/endonuclease Cas3, partial [Eubacterium aggregans]
GEPLICISTQLIEAGVDISFKCVIRSLAGLDSIAQAAGRCNRNGEVLLGSVFVLKYDAEHLDKLPDIKKAQDSIVQGNTRAWRY